MITEEAYKTSIKRIKMTAPCKWLLSNGFIKGPRVLDYGCGKSIDTDLMATEDPTLDLHKYDPNPSLNLSMPEGKFNTIICIYVCNVVSEEVEKEVIEDIRSRLVEGGKGYVVVRRDLPEKLTKKQQTRQRHSFPALESLIKKERMFEVYTVR